MPALPKNAILGNKKVPVFLYFYASLGNRKVSVFCKCELWALGQYKAQSSKSLKLKVIV